MAAASWERRRRGRRRGVGETCSGGGETTPLWLQLLVLAGWVASAHAATLASPSTTATPTKTATGTTTGTASRTPSPSVTPALYPAVSGMEPWDGTAPFPVIAAARPASCAGTAYTAGYAGGLSRISGQGFSWAVKGDSYLRSMTLGGMVANLTLTGATTMTFTVPLLPPGPYTLSALAIGPYVAVAGGGSLLAASFCILPPVAAALPATELMGLNTLLRLTFSPATLQVGSGQLLTPNASIGGYNLTTLSPDASAGTVVFALPLPTTAGMAALSAAWASATAPLPVLLTLAPGLVVPLLACTTPTLSAASPVAAVNISIAVPTIVRVAPAAPLLPAGGDSVFIEWGAAYVGTPPLLLAAATPFLAPATLAARGLSPAAWPAMVRDAAAGAGCLVGTGSTATFAAGVASCTTTPGMLLLNGTAAAARAWLAAPGSDLDAVAAGVPPLATAPVVPCARVTADVAGSLTCETLSGAPRALAGCGWRLVVEVSGSYNLTYRPPRLPPGACTCNAGLGSALTSTPPAPADVLPSLAGSSAALGVASAVALTTCAAAAASPLSFAAPVLVGTSPTQVSVPPDGWANASLPATNTSAAVNLTLYGTGFSGLVAAGVAGVPCTNLNVSSDTLAVCSGLCWGCVAAVLRNVTRQARVVGSWPGDVTLVAAPTLAGGSLTPGVAWATVCASVNDTGCWRVTYAGSVTLLGAALVTAIVPNPATPNSTVVVVGEALGAVAGEVVGVSVGPAHCLAPRWLSSTAVSCQLPPERPAGAQSNLSVRVDTTGGSGAVPGYVAVGLPSGDTPRARVPSTLSPTFTYPSPLLIAWDATFAVAAAARVFLLPSTSASPPAPFLASPVPTVAVLSGTPSWCTLTVEAPAAGAPSVAVVSGLDTSSVRFPGVGLGVTFGSAAWVNCTCRDRFGWEAVIPQGAPPILFSTPTAAAAYIAGTPPAGVAPGAPPGAVLPVALAPWRVGLNLSLPLDGATWPASVASNGGDVAAGLSCTVALRGSSFLNRAFTRTAPAASLVVSPSSLAMVAAVAPSLLTAPFDKPTVATLTCTWLPTREVLFSPPSLFLVAHRPAVALAPGSTWHAAVAASGPPGTPLPLSPLPLGGVTFTLTLTYDPHWYGAPEGVAAAVSSLVSCWVALTRDAADVASGLEASDTGEVVTSDVTLSVASARLVTTTTATAPAGSVTNLTLVFNATGLSAGAATFGESLAVVAACRWRAVDDADGGGGAAATFGVTVDALATVVVETPVVIVWAPSLAPGLRQAAAIEPSAADVVAAVKHRVPPPAALAPTAAAPLTLFTAFRLPAGTAALHDAPAALAAAPTALSCTASLATVAPVSTRLAAAAAVGWNTSDDTVASTAALAGDPAGTGDGYLLLRTPVGGLSAAGAEYGDEVTVAATCTWGLGAPAVAPRAVDARPANASIPIPTVAVAWTAYPPGCRTAGCTAPLTAYANATHATAAPLLAVPYNTPAALTVAVPALPPAAAASCSLRLARSTLLLDAGSTAAVSLAGDATCAFSLKVLGDVGTEDALVVACTAWGHSFSAPGLRIVLGAVAAAVVTAPVATVFGGAAGGGGGGDGAGDDASDLTVYLAPVPVVSLQLDTPAAVPPSLGGAVCTPRIAAVWREDDDGSLSAIPPDVVALGGDGAYACGASGECDSVGGVRLPHLSLASTNASMGAVVAIAVECQRAEGDAALPTTFNVTVLPLRPAWRSRPPVAAPPLVPLAEFSVEVTGGAGAVNVSAVLGLVSCTAALVDEAGGRFFARPVTVPLGRDWAAVFSDFSVVGPRMSKVPYTVRCTVAGTAALDALEAHVAIAGCEAGTAPFGVGWFCAPCGENMWSDGGDAPCTACPSTGATCLAGRINLLPNFYRPPSEAHTNITQASTLLPCFNSESCTLAADSRTYGCAPGYSGPRCAVCDRPAGYELFSQACRPCWDAGWSALLLAAIVIAFLAIIVFIATRPRNRTRSQASIALRIMLSFGQGLAALKTFKAGGTETFRKMFAFTDAINDSPLSQGPVQCLLHMSYTSKYLTTVLSPILAAAAVIVMFCLVTLVRGARSASKRSSREGGERRRGTPVGGTIGSVTAAGSGAAGSTRRALQMDWVKVRRDLGVYFRRHEYLSTTVFVLFLSFMPLVGQSIKSLSCYSPPIDGVVYLAADFRVVCNQGEHLLARTVAWAVLALVGIGFPVALLFTLRWVAATRHLLALGWRDARAARWYEQATVTLRFLFAGYRDGTLWWEVVVLARKASFAMLTGLLTDAFYQIAAAVLITAASMWAHERFQPYTEARFNRMDGYAQLATFVTAVISMLYLRSTVTEQNAGASTLSTGTTVVTATTDDAATADLAVTIVLVLVNAAVALYILVALIRLYASAAAGALEARRARKAAARKKAIDAMRSRRSPRDAGAARSALHRLLPTTAADSGDAKQAALPHKSVAAARRPTIALAAIRTQSPLAAAVAASMARSRDHDTDPALAEGDDEDVEEGSVSVDSDDEDDDDGGGGADDIYAEVAADLDEEARAVATAAAAEAAAEATATVEDEVAAAGEPHAAGDGHDWTGHNPLRRVSVVSRRTSVVAGINPMRLAGPTRAALLPTPVSSSLPRGPTSPAAATPRRVSVVASGMVSRRAAQFGGGGGVATFSPQPTTSSTTRRL